MIPKHSTKLERTFNSHIVLENMFVCQDLKRNFLQSVIIPFVEFNDSLKKFEIKLRFSFDLRFS